VTHSGASDVNRFEPPHIAQVRATRTRAPSLSVLSTLALTQSLSLR
jgi:hypothetical protein